MASAISGTRIARRCERKSCARVDADDEAVGILVSVGRDRPRSCLGPATRVSARPRDAPEPAVRPRTCGGRIASSVSLTFSGGQFGSLRNRAWAWYELKNACQIILKLTHPLLEK